MYFLLIIHNLNAMYLKVTIHDRLKQFNIKVFTITKMLDFDFD